MTNTVGKEQEQLREHAAQDHCNRGKKAADAGKFEKAICEYKAALELSPHLGLETIICWNCAFAIWHRPGFWEKAGVTQSEYRDILALRALLMRAVSIYENSFRGNQKLEAAFGKIYQDAKKELDYTKGKLVIVPDGELRVPMIIPERTPDSFNLNDWFREHCDPQAGDQLDRMTLGDLIWWLPEELNPPKAIAEMTLSRFDVKGVTQTTLASLKSAVSFMISPDRTTWYVALFDVRDPMALIERGDNGKIQIQFHLDPAGRVQRYDVAT